MFCVTWFGVFTPKAGELYAVEETETQAQATAAHLAGKGKPWPVKPVIITDMLLLGGIQRMISEIHKEAKK